MLVFRSFALIFITNCFNLVEIVKAKEVLCEKVNDYAWEYNVGTVKTCLMNETTSIDEPSVIISSRDDSMFGFWLFNNKQIHNLPTGVSEKFPNLLGYNAGFCSIKEISRENFKGLTKLKLLFLHYTQIEKISSETFSDLKSLETLALRKIFFVASVTICEFLDFFR